MPGGDESVLGILAWKEGRVDVRRAEGREQRRDLEEGWIKKELKRTYRCGGVEPSAGYSIRSPTTLRFGLSAS